MTSHPIHVFTRPTMLDPDAVHQMIDVFDAADARYWDLETSDGSRNPLNTVPIRLWLTAGGRWVVTRSGRGDHYYVTDEEAEALFGENGYGQAERDIWVRTLV